MLISSLAKSKSLIVRDIAALVGTNVVGRAGSLVLAILLARTTRSLSATLYSLTFTAIAAGQVMVSLDLGVGSLAVDLAARGIRVDRVVVLLRPLRSKLKVGLLLVVLPLGIGEYVVLGFASLTFGLHLDPGAALLVIIQLLLVGFVVYLGVYERALFGARAAKSLTRGSVLGLSFSCSLLFVATHLPNSLVSTISITAVFGGLLISRVANRQQVRKMQSAEIEHCDIEITSGEKHRARSFWILQLCGVTAFGLDQLVVSALRGSSEAASFSAHSRYFQIGASVLSVFVTSVWPPMAAAIARADIEGARKLYLVAIFVVAGTAILWVTPLAAGYLRVSLFKAGEPNRPSLIVPMTVWFVLSQVGALLGQVQSALRDLRYLVKIGLGMALTNLVLSIVLCRNFGSKGVLWGSIISYPVIVLFPVLNRMRHDNFWIGARIERNA
jgi:hypothetical protein